MTFHVATQAKKLHVLAASLDRSYAVIFPHLTVTSRQTKQIYSFTCTDTYHIHACTHHFNYHVPREHGLHLHTAYIYILRIFITDLLRRTHVTNIYFPISLKIYLPFINAACEVRRDNCIHSNVRTVHSAAARRKRYVPLYRHFRTVSKYVRVSADALTAANRHARHGRRVLRVVNAAR